MPSANVTFGALPLTRLLPFYPGQMGVPGSDNDRGLRMDTLGQVFYVDPNHAAANANNDGTDSDNPLSTVAAALTRCSPYHNDVVAVMFNSDWTYGSIAVGRPLPIREAVTVSVPGVRIVGVAPSGALGVPWCPTGNGAASITVNAMDVLIEGFNFWDDTYTATIGILAQWNSPALFGENLTVRHCHFYEKGYGIVLDYVWNSYIHDCKFDSCDTEAIFNRSTYGDIELVEIKRCVFANNASAINLPDSDYNIIENCHLVNNVLGITMGVTSSYNIINNNVIIGTAAGTNNFINLSGGGGVMNMVSDNWLGCTVAQYDTTCSPGGGGTDMWVRNHLRDGESAANPT